MPRKFRLVPLAAFLLAAFGAASASAQETTSASAATIDKVGWWNATRGPQPGEPDNPLRPLLTPVPPPPTNTPGDAVGVAASAGEPTKVAAVGILLDGPTGGTVDTLELTLKESPSSGANVGADQAVIVACPIKGFWGDTRDGNWVDRPEADCSLASAKGTRDADGTWTFDLTSVATAAAWLDPTFSTGQNGVLLVEQVDAPGGFDVSFLDPAAHGMTVEFAASGGEPVTDPFATPSDSFGATTFAPADGDVGRTDPFTLGPSPVPSASGGTPGATAAEPGGPASLPPRGSTQLAAAVLVGNLPWAVYLLIPIAVVAAVALSLVLGAPSGYTTSTSPAAGTAPVPGRRRLGGVSRALARREHTSSTATPHA